MEGASVRGQQRPNEADDGPQSMGTNKTPEIQVEDHATTSIMILTIQMTQIEYIYGY